MEKVKALEQLTLRLAYMADGVDSDIDAILDTVRKLIKEGADAGRLEDASSKLTRALMSNTGMNPDKPKTIEGGYDLSGLRKLVKAMPVASNEQERMSEIVQQVAAGQTSLARQKALVDLLNVASQAIREVASRDKSDGGVLGWLGKKSGGDPGDERYVAMFASLLKRMVEHLDVLNGTGASSTSIKEALEMVGYPEQAETLLEEVTREIEIIDARIRAERNQTTDFLGDLRERLSGFEDVINLLAQSGESSLERSEGLQIAVSEDTREIGEAVKSDDLAAIRGKINENMGKIAERLAQHVLEEREQNAESKAKVAELNDRLSRLEDEADVLRSEIRNKNDLALKDSLTGVYNRAGYEERTTELFARWERSGAPLSMVFVDCNKFKEINDNYGHAAGDLVLVKVAEVLTARARASDIVCRYGGDEFVVLLPDTAATGAEVFARSACQEVLEAGFNDNGKPLDVSISCGVTELISGDSLEVAMARADEAMYKAKKMDGINVCLEV